MTDTDSDTARQISLGLDDWDLYFADHFDQIIFSPKTKEAQKKQKVSVTFECPYCNKVILKKSKYYHIKKYHK